MFLELIDIEVFPIQPIISLMKCDTMIPNASCNKNTADKVVILFGLINFKLKGFHAFFPALFA